MFGGSAVVTSSDAMVLIPVIGGTSYLLLLINKTSIERSRERVLRNNKP